MVGFFFVLFWKHCPHRLMICGFGQVIWSMKNRAQDSGEIRKRHRGKDRAGLFRDEVVEVLFGRNKDGEDHE